MRISVWALSVWLCTGGVAGAEVVELTLNPPLDKELRLVSTLTYVVTSDDPAAEPLSTWTTTHEDHIVVTEEQGRRWLTSRRPEIDSAHIKKHTSKSPTRNLDGRLVSAKIRSGLLWGLVSFEFDKQGQFVQVDRSRGVAAEGQATGWMPEEALPVEARLLWQQLYGNLWGGLAGRRVEAGTSWMAQIPGRLCCEVGGLTPVPLLGRWTVIGRETPSPESRVQIHYETAQDAVPLEGEVAEWVGAWVSKMTPPERDREVWSSFTVRQKGELLVDPAILLRGTEWIDEAHVTFNAGIPSAHRLHVHVTTVRKWSE